MDFLENEEKPAAAEGHPNESSVPYIFGLTVNVFPPKI